MASSLAAGENSAATQSEDASGLRKSLGSGEEHETTAAKFEDTVTAL
jgi:hypothetical protein